MLAASAAVLHHHRGRAGRGGRRAVRATTPISIVDTSQEGGDKTWKIEGVAGKVLGIDVRPADGMLYAVGADGGIYTVDMKTGKATMKSKLETMLDARHLGDGGLQPGGRPPAPDGQRRHQPSRQRRRRQGHERRLAQVRRRPTCTRARSRTIVAGAYTNSFKGAKETALYDIDATIGALIKQAPPNDGILNAVGKLGVKAEHRARSTSGRTATARTKPG